jgi:predicted AAA+ superfamily ATPase
MEEADGFVKEVEADEGILKGPGFELEEVVMLLLLALDKEAEDDDFEGAEDPVFADVDNGIDALASALEADEEAHVQSPSQTGHRSKSSSLSSRTTLCSS